uniref:Uncharacterized protein n=1 Tax=Lepeophtheirus salmonis TaxID=72036 RepID=A0A0K2T4V6_LEPSM
MESDSRDKLLTADDPLIRNCRSALLEEENVRLKSAINLVRQEITSSAHSSNQSELVEKIKEIVNDEELTKKDTLLRRQNVLSHVRAELEHERRIRTQEALDEAERRCYQLGKELELKVSMYEEKVSNLESTRERLQKDIDELGTEKNKLTSRIRIKEDQLTASEIKSKELIRKANQFEELFNGQLESVKVLQNDLTIASEENKGLVKEMELLNKMFYELERTHVTDALKNYKDEDSPEIALFKNAIMKEDGKDCKNPSSIDDSTKSCFKEVTTRNGTRMVLSVSKTFLKLQDLILQKKTLEDEVEKMKKINAHLANKVNLHEAKLFNITDELNKTWNYVSNLKTQHSQLHTSELILRAELAEKRNLLAKLREELEYSRESWNVVKQKTAESEKEWKSLRDEFAARRLAFKPFQPTSYTSSESGYSDRETPETPIKDESNCDVEEEEIFEELNVNESSDSDTETEKSDHEEPNNFNRAMTESTHTLFNVEDEIPIQTSLVLIPSLSYLAQVPTSLMPPLLSHDEEDYQELYHNLIQSTNRSAALANKLAEINRTSETEEYMDSEGNHDSDENSDREGDEEEEEEILENPFGSSESLDGYIRKRGLDSEGFDVLISETTLSSSSDNDYSSCCDLEEEGEEEEVEDIGTVLFEEQILPLPTSSTLPLSLTTIIPPTSVLALSREVDEESDDDNEENGDPDRLSESATTVTRFLIKHLPKQLSRLRTDKMDLEEKIRGLEARISEQNITMSELDRRTELYKKEAQKRSISSCDKCTSTIQENSSEINKHLSNSKLIWTISKIDDNVFMFLSSNGETDGEGSLIKDSVDLKNDSVYILSLKDNERILCQIKVYVR